MEDDIKDFTNPTQEEIDTLIYENKKMLDAWNNCIKNIDFGDRSNITADEIIMRTAEEIIHSDIPESYKHYWRKIRYELIFQARFSEMRRQGWIVDLKND